MSNLFEDQYRKAGVHAQRRYPNETLIADMASKFFGLVSEERQKVSMLELGCGSGANLWMMAAEGFKVSGLDLSPSGIEICRNQLQRRDLAADLRVASMTELPFDDASFDYVCDVASMQHLDLNQHKECLKESLRVLRPGSAFFSYHLGWRSSCVAAIDSWVDDATVLNIPSGYPLAGNGRTCFLSEERAFDLLKNAGFDEIGVDRVERTYGGQCKTVEYLVMTGRKPNEISERGT